MQGRGWAMCLRWKHSTGHTSGEDADALHDVNVHYGDLAHLDSKQQSSGTKRLLIGYQQTKQSYYSWCVIIQQFPLFNSSLVLISKADLTPAAYSINCCHLLSQSGRKVVVINFVQFCPILMETQTALYATQQIFLGVINVSHLFSSTSSNRMSTFLLRMEL